jgi:integrase
VLGLQRRDIDELHGTVKIALTWLQIANGSAQEGLSKTKAGHCTVNIPPFVVDVLRDHLDRFTGPSPNSWLFSGEGDNPASPRTLDRAWDTARRATGREDLRFYDLRHTGLTWSAGLGATTAELMHRAGHKSPAAALRYQHATQDRDAVLADALGALATGGVVHLKRTKVVHLKRTKDGQNSGGSDATAGRWAVTRYNSSRPNGIRTRVATLRERVATSTGF